MKTGLLAILLGLVLGNQAYAGGGGCGDYCDQYSVILSCTAKSFIVTSPEELIEKYDILNVKALQNQMKEDFKVTFYGISKSYNHSFDPAVLYRAYVVGLYDSILTDHLKWPNYDYTKGYKVDPDSGAFQFSGIAAPGWNRAKAKFINNGTSETNFTMHSIETGALLMEAQLSCK